MIDTTETTQKTEATNLPGNAPSLALRTRLQFLLSAPLENLPKMQMTPALFIKKQKRQV